ncbi:MAG: acetyl-CoA hydrolase/transferase family protein [Alphaproteobacteria bacterium]
MAEDHRSKLRTAEEAAALVRDVDDVLLPLAPAQPAGFLRALGRRERFERLRLLCALLQEPFELLSRPGVLVASQFFGPVERMLRGAGVPIEHVTADFHGLELLARRTKPRVVASAVAPPDEDGFLSFGLHAGASAIPFLEAARDPERLAVAEINPRMPRTRGLPEFGGHRVHASEVDVLLECDAPLFALPESQPDDADRRIAALVGDLVPDGATLQFGIGSVPNEIATILAAGPHGDFGIHTEMVVDGVMLLHEAGKVANRKGLHDGWSIATFGLGSQALYDWLGGDTPVRFLPVSQTNPPHVVSRNRRMISVNAAIMIDLSGQVVADTVAGRQHSGVGGHESFVTGARESDGGTSILCLHSTKLIDGVPRSRILDRLPPGSIVTTPRHQVDRVATEHGIVQLFGLSDRERAEALVELADPAFRGKLRAAARGRVSG